MCANLLLNYVWIHNSIFFNICLVKRVYYYNNNNNNNKQKVLILKKIQLYVLPIGFLQLISSSISLLIRTSCPQVSLGLSFYIALQKGLMTNIKIIIQYKFKNLMA